MTVYSKVSNEISYTSVLLPFETFFFFLIVYFFPKNVSFREFSLHWNGISVDKDIELEAVWFKEKISIVKYDCAYLLSASKLNEVWVWMCFLIYNGQAVKNNSPPKGLHIYVNVRAFLWHDIIPLQLTHIIQGCLWYLLSWTSATVSCQQFVFFNLESI